MIWAAPSEKDPDSEPLEKRLGAAADQLRANSGLTSQQYSQPVLGLIFLRFAEVTPKQVWSSARHAMHWRLWLLHGSLYSGQKSLELQVWTKTTIYHRFSTV
jgi:hypothetical protein